MGDDAADRAAELEFEDRLRFDELMGAGVLLEHDSRFMTPYEAEASTAESMNRFVDQAPASRRGPKQVLEIRKDQARTAEQRRADIFAAHEWVEVDNVHPESVDGRAVEPVSPGFDSTPSRR